MSTQTTLTASVRAAALTHLNLPEGTPRALSNHAGYALPPSPPGHYTSSPEAAAEWRRQERILRDEITDCEGPGCSYVYTRRAMELTALGWDAEVVANALHDVLFPREEE